MITVEHVPMQLIVAAGLMVATAVVQTVGVVMLEEFVWLWRDRVAENTSPPRMMSVLSAVIVYLFALHVAEISIWAVFYRRVTAYPTFAVALYESGLAFTTLDVPQLPPAWKFLGAAEAIAGVLMFAWSTAVLFKQTLWLSEAREKYFRRALVRPR